MKVKVNSLAPIAKSLILKSVAKNVGSFNAEAQRMFGYRLKDLGYRRFIGEANSQ